MSEHDPIQRQVRTASLHARVRLLRLLGEELISDEPVAVVELVKNAYDADASMVTVSFEATENGLPNRIVIKDDGHGMSTQTVLDAWLEPGTSFKRKRNPATSPGGRKLQGAKGIGRFATARLADNMLMETIEPGSGLQTSVLMEWGRLNDDQLLSDVPVEYEVDAADPLTHGTTITLEGLRREWNNDDYVVLRSRLERLVSPFKEVSDFDIYLDHPGVDEDDRRIEPPSLLLKARYELSGVVSADGLFTGIIAVEGYEKEALTDLPLPDLPRDKSLKGVQQDSLLILDEDRCGPFTLQIRAWDRDEDGLRPYLDKQHLSIADVRRTLDAFCGVSIYRDGFRVYPYGQKGDDWMNLDVRSRLNPGLRLANNQVVGAISISREANPNLLDRSSREGMIRNRAHAQLEERVKRALMLLEKPRYESRSRKGAISIPTRAEPVFGAFNLEPTISKLTIEAKASKQIIDIVREADAQIKEGVERVQDLYSRLLASAGLGHLVDLVIHEIGSPLGKAVLKTQALEKTVKAEVADPPQAKLLEMALELKAWHGQISALRERLDPNTPAKRGKATVFDVRSEIEATLELFEATLTKDKIHVESLLPKEEVKVKLKRSAVSQVLANLVDNAVYWLKTREAAPSRVLRVTLTPTALGFEIAVSDNGPGVESDIQPYIFEPYFTTKADGMGLGLYIARLVIEPYGQVVLAETPEIGGATFRAIFERSTGT